jgi:hypothetical protein
MMYGVLSILDEKDLSLEHVGDSLIAVPRGIVVSNLLSCR